MKVIIEFNVNTEDELKDLIIILGKIGNVEFGTPITNTQSVSQLNLTNEPIIPFIPATSSQLNVLRYATLEEFPEQVSVIIDKLSKSEAQGYVGKVFKMRNDKKKEKDRADYPVISYSEKNIQSNHPFPWEEKVKCVIEDCKATKIVARGYCSKHYYQWSKTNKKLK